MYGSWKRARRGEERRRTEIRLNPVEQEEAEKWMGRGGLNFPVLSPDLWSGDIYRVEEAINKQVGPRRADHFRLNELIRRKKMLKPLSAVKCDYEDPLCPKLAEAKVLSSRGVNFFIISRSVFQARQLGKRIALNVNSVLIDPMQMIENKYQKEAKGYYIPPNIEDKLQDHLLGNATVKIAELTSFFKTVQDQNKMKDNVSAEQLRMDKELEKVYLKLISSKIIRESVRKNIAEIIEDLNNHKKAIEECLDTSYHHKNLREDIAKKNFVSLRDYSAEQILEMIEGFECFTKGYVLVYDALYWKNDRSLWKKILSCNNPPDIILYGQCPNDELKLHIQELKLNPFVCNEYYNSKFFKEIRNDYEIYTFTKGFTSPHEVKEHVQNTYKDRCVPLRESIMLEYSEIICRRNLLCEVSEMCRKLKERLYEEHFLGEGSQSKDTVRGEGSECEYKEDPEEMVLGLENYVKLPEAILSVADQIDKTFIGDFFSMVSSMNNHPTYIIKTDIRTPICYQYSLVKRWFDYSGLYAKPRARCGNLAKVSVFCEIIGQSSEQIKLRNEFSADLNNKIRKYMAKKPEEEAEEMLEEQVNWLKEGFFGRFGEEGEEFMEKPMKSLKEVLSATSMGTISSLSEFENLVGYSGKRDEFSLDTDFMMKISYLADMLELHAKDNVQFFQKYQCYLSTWEDRCPVAHYEGKCQRGSLDNAVRLHDKVYYCSSMDAMKSFMNQPAKYLLPPLPESYCAVLILGGPENAAKYTAEAIAQFFEAKILDYNQIIQKTMEKFKNIYLQSATDEALQLLKSVYAEGISSQYMEQSLKMVEWLDKACQLITFRRHVHKPILYDLYPSDTEGKSDDNIAVVSEHYPTQESEFDVIKLLRKAKLKEVAESLLMRTIEKYSNQVDFKPYFLKDTPGDVTSYGILLESILRKEFKQLGLLDIYGSYNLCSFYARNPQRLLERLPIQLIPKIEQNKEETDIKNVKSEIGDFFFPLDTVPLSVSEKIHSIGKEIIKIENKARFSGKEKYGGWIIYGMPLEEQLLKSLDKAGIFPRNIIHLDDPENIYKKRYEKHHEHQAARKEDIGKNLKAYVHPYLRNEIIYLNNENPQKNTINQNNVSKIEKKGEEIARLSTEYRFVQDILEPLVPNELPDFWPGQKGLNNHIERRSLYADIENQPDFKRFMEAGFETYLEAYEIQYRNYGRYQFKILESVALVNLAVASKLRPSLYGGNVFKPILEQEKRLRVLLSMFLKNYEVENYLPELLKFSTFLFSNELKKLIKQPLFSLPQFNPENLNYLTYTIENSMLLPSEKRGVIFEKILKLLKDLGYSFGIERTMPIEKGEITHVTWKEKEMHRSLLYVEKKKRIYAKIIDYDYIFDKLYEIRIAKNKPVKCSLVQNRYSELETESFDEEMDSTDSTESKSFLTLMTDMTRLHVDVLKSILDYDISIILFLNEENNNEDKVILNFPENPNFLPTFQKYFDLILMTNRFLKEKQEIINKNGELNSFTILQNDSEFWKDWQCVLNDRKRHSSPQNNFDLNHYADINVYLDVLKKKSLSEFCKKVAKLQKEIEMLRELKNTPMLSVEEDMLLQFLIWVRNEYFKRYLTGVVDTNYATEEGSGENPNGETLQTYAQTNHFQQIISPEAYFIKSDPWPFRNNYKNFPKHVRLYKCTLWKELNQLTTYKESVKGKRHTTFQMAKSKKSFKTDSEVEDRREKEQFIKDLIEFINNSSPYMTYNEFARQKNIIKQKLAEQKTTNVVKEHLDERKKTISGKESIREPYTDVESITKKIMEISHEIEAKGSLQKDGGKKTKKRKRQMKLKDMEDRNNKQMSLEQLQTVKMVLSEINAITKVTMVSLDDHGPYNILYTILDDIRASRGLPKLKGTYPTMIPYKIKEQKDILYEGYSQSHSSLDSDISLSPAFDHKNVCIISYFDGDHIYGLEGLSADFNGRTYYFCSYECLMKFRLSPENYSNAAKAQNVKPLNIFYPDIPGSIGKVISATLSYYFGINLFYMDDFIMETIGSSNKNDLRSVALVNKILSANGGINQKIIGEDFLWAYTMQEEKCPNLMEIIKNYCKDKGENVCMYNVPHHQGNLKDIFKTCLHPEVVIFNNKKCLKKIMDFLNLDVLKSYAKELSEAKNNTTEKYLQDFKLWVEAWQSRFIKLLKYLTREEPADTIMKLQLILKEIITKKLNYIPDYDDISLWTSSNFTFISGFERRPEPPMSSEKSLLVIAPKDGKQTEKLQKDGDAKSEPPMFKDSEQIKEVADTIRNIEIMSRDNLNAINEASNTKKGRQENWYCQPKMALGYSDLKYITNENIFKSLRQALKKEIKEELDAGLVFQETIKQNVFAKKTFMDDEENLRAEVLSVDSIAFEDYDTPVLEDINVKTKDCLPMLTIALKHANVSNPIPAPAMSKEFQNSIDDELKDITKQELGIFDWNCEQFKEYFQDRVEEFDFMNESVKDLIYKIKGKRKEALLSECVVEVSKEDAEKLMETGYYFLSKYGRDCPVQVKQIISYINKISILYRAKEGVSIPNELSSVILPTASQLFIGGSKELLENFIWQPLEYVDKADYTPVIPIKIIFFGPKTEKIHTVLNNLAKEYSLEHIDLSAAIEHYIQMGGWTRLGQRYRCNVSYLHGLPYPPRLPVPLIWEAVSSLTASPKSSTHGYLISGFMPHAELYQTWGNEHFHPSTIFYSTIYDKNAFAEELKMNEFEKELHPLGTPLKYRKYIKKLVEYSSFKHASSQSQMWFNGSHVNNKTFLKNNYYNINCIRYENNGSEMLGTMVSSIMDLLKEIKLWHETDIGGNQSPVPIGNFISYNDWEKLKDECWDKVCPACVCTSKRYKLTENPVMKRNIMLFNNKCYNICDNHKLDFLLSPADFTTNPYLKINLPQETEEKKLKIKDTSFDGICPVCFWLQRPHIEYQYRCGSSKFINKFEGNSYKCCSEFCRNEFAATPWMYGFLGKCRIQCIGLPYVDTKHWSEAAMKSLNDEYIFIKDAKDTFFYQLLRLAANIKIFYPGWTKYDARIFFIYALAKRYMSGPDESYCWHHIILDFLHRCGISKRIIEGFLVHNEKYFTLPELVPYFNSFMTK